MYARNTILSLKNPKDPDDETDEPFPYNEVRVVGESPVSHTYKGEWMGADAKGVIIVPLTNFGATLDEPFGKLRSIYDVKEEPDNTVPVEVRHRIIDSSTSAAGKTPEEVFAAEAPGTPPNEGEIRGRTPMSPLDDPGPADAKSPLDDD